MSERDALPPLLQRLLKVMEQAERYKSQKRKQRRKGILPFHIQHNTTPQMMEIWLRTLEPLHRITGLSQSTWGKIKAFLNQLGVLARDGSLAPFGERLRCLLQNHPELLAEAVHGHLYTMHRFDPSVRFSFAYATICDWLWERGEVALTGKVTSELVGLVVERGAEFYQIPAEQIAFSTNSVRGALNWLKALNPPVLERDASNRFWVFRRRRECHPLNVTWVLSTWFRLNEMATGGEVIWHAELEDFLTRCLMLEEGCAKISVEVASEWHRWRNKVLEAEKRDKWLAAVRLNNPLEWGNVV